MKRFFVTLLLAMSVACISRATDIPIFPTGPVFKFQSTPTWGISGPGGFNNNFLFTPLNQNESVCVYVRNNNTTNPHTFTAAITITADPSNGTPSDGTWQTSASAGLFSATSPGLPSGIGASVSGVAQVSINFSGSSTQAGSPDTATVTVVQTGGNCFAGNQFVGSAPQTISSVTPLQAISDGLSQGFFGNSGVITNPLIASMLVQVNPNNGTKTVYLDHALFSCSAACSINFNLTSSVGSGCTSLGGAGNLKSGNATASAALSNITCTGLPTSAGQPITGLSVPANTTFNVDLRGFILPAGTLNGIETTMAAALTGTITVQFFWYEK